MGATWKHLGVISGHLGGTLGASWGILGAFSESWNALTGVLASSLKHVSSLSKIFKNHLKKQKFLKVFDVWREVKMRANRLTWGILGASWGHLGLSWGILGYLGASCGHLGAILCHLGGILGLLGASWCHLGGILKRLGAQNNDFRNRS